MNRLHRRIIDISYKLRLSHIGSCLTSVDIIKDIYSKMKRGDRFVLSNGHAGLALYVVLEDIGLGDAEEKFRHHGTHPDRCAKCHIDCSTGSLGQGLPIAIGMALADPSIDVYCLISDGECAEGSILESFRIITELNLKNLHVYLNYNGMSAYRKPAPVLIPSWLKVIHTNVDELLPVLKEPMEAHYKVLSEEEYLKIIYAGS